MQVSVTLDRYLLAETATKQAAVAAFGGNIARSILEVTNGRRKEVRVLATAGQLVAFQVARNELGGQNLWKSLKVKILTTQVNETGKVIYYDAISGRVVKVA